MSEARYGNTRVAKIRAAYNDLRSALAGGDLEAAQAAFDRYEQWSDYILDKRHSDRDALEARVKALTAATDMAIKRLEMCCDKAWNGDARDFKRSLYGIFSEYRAALQENTDDR